MDDIVSLAVFCLSLVYNTKNLRHYSLLIQDLNIQSQLVTKLLDDQASIPRRACGKNCFLFATVSRLDLGHTQPSTQWVHGFVL